MILSTSYLIWSLQLKAFQAVDLHSQTITLPDGSSEFEVDSFRKHCLLNGLDDIALTLEDADKIRAFEVLHKQRPLGFTASSIVCGFVADLSELIAKK